MTSRWWTIRGALDWVVEAGAEPVMKGDWVNGLGNDWAKLYGLVWVRTWRGAVFEWGGGVARDEVSESSSPVSFMGRARMDWSVGISAEIGEPLGEEGVYVKGIGFVRRGGCWRCLRDEPALVGDGSVGGRGTTRGGSGDLGSVSADTE